MEKNKVKVGLSFGIFSVFFISSVLMLIVNFISRNFLLLAMVKMNYATEIPIIAEPILVGLSGLCLVISGFSLGFSLYFIRK